jgi:hypothetical protein
MCFERITDCVPRIVGQEAITEITRNKTCIFSEDVSYSKKLPVYIIMVAGSNYKAFLIGDATVVGKARCQALQTTVSAQPIHENKTVNVTII